MQVLKGMIGLEIHAYPITREKLFCRCRASREKGTKANSNICPICVGQPGSKPMMANEEAVKKAVMVGLMLGCKINQGLVWQRKHYDWPDMPKGFQNTISGPKMVGVGELGEFFGIGIRSMHLEEDPAAWDPESGKVDYNRSGLPLLEIITEPDFATAEEVVGWLRKLVHSLSYLKAIEKDAGIKVDVNVNLENVKFSSPTTTKKHEVAGIPSKTERVEIKNVNSIENIGKAIEYEFERQSNEGGTQKETRRFDAQKGKTIVMRKKEGADDYRFISDPDLVDVIIEKKFVGDIEKGLPESPEEKLERFIKKHKIGKADASVLAKNIDIAEFYEAVLEKSKLPVAFVTPWVTVELLRHLNYNKTTLDNVDIAVGDFVNLLKLVKDGTITEQQGKGILNKFYPKSFDPSKGVKEKISGTGELEKVVKSVIAKNGKAVEDYKAGEKKALHYLMGQVMKETKGRADFSVVQKLLKNLLK